MRRPATSLAVLALAVCAAATDASACRGLFWERSIFFDEVPAGIEAPAIAKVFVVAVVPNGSWQVGIAYVQQAVKGSFDRWWPLRIALRPTSCGPYLRAGISGFVAGELRRGAYGMLELDPVAESYGEREVRKNTTQEKRS